MALAQDLKNLGGRLEVLGENGVACLEAVTSHPEGPAVLADLAALTRFDGLRQGTISGLAAPLRSFLAAVAPVSAPSSL